MWSPNLAVPAGTSPFIQVLFSQTDVGSIVMLMNTYCTEEKLMRPVEIPYRINLENIAGPSAATMTKKAEKIHRKRREEKRQKLFQACLWL